MDVCIILFSSHKKLLTDLIQVVYKAEWVTGFGIFFCLLNIVLFLTNCVLLSMRFYMRPGSLTKSFTDQVESLFIPAFVSLSYLHRVSL
jgi:hypothetical protein